MKEILGTTSNHLARHTDAGLEPSVEVILVTSEPRYSVDPAGGMARSRTVESVRFVASPQQLRDLAAQLVEMADGADELMEAAKDLLKGNEPKGP